MSETYHIAATKDHGVSPIKLLKETAIEDLELQQFEVFERKKAN